MLDLRDSKGETRINALNAQCGIKICNDGGIHREILEVELTKGDKRGFIRLKRANLNFFKEFTLIFFWFFWSKLTSDNV
jgi:hypothetical protein